MGKHGGVLPLPVMKNAKTIDPRNKTSTQVLQLETAMGAAIECFDGAEAVLVPRERFSPVKTTNELLGLMSDAYEATPDHRMVLRKERKGVPPNVKLDGAYKFVDSLKSLVPDGAPSLLYCKSLTVEGKVVFAPKVVIKGTVKFKNIGPVERMVRAGTYQDNEVIL
uniref:UTP--glucose-1-phosphate uridylyltransferase n=1 Tax=Coccolithus braarudii TaxID=221442 RepID=A0A7S0Q694_9EUKA|mmetsp:Transcript_41629/g.88845  ORF Transcript_41629/g.88845 Transcript_41629/m.88845 type:complete len:166 (+) Transcript_41629:236-733(+)